MIATLFLLPLAQVAPQAERPPALMVGDAAPTIEVVEWVQGQPLSAFEPGKVYVMEFWATWCGPCKVAIPHLNELSKQYAGRVQFVGVSVWEDISAEQPYAVPSFVKEMGDQMTYTVAADRVKESDPHRMSEKWMKAAGQGGIPATFVVNGQGRVAWIGHPMGLEKPLAEIVAGTWDLEKAAQKFALDMRVKALSQKLGREVSRAKKEKDFATALKVLDEAFAKEPTLEATFGLERYFLLLDAQRGAEAALYGNRLVAEVLAENPMALNQLAWTIVDPQGRVKNGDFMLAVRAAERAVELQQSRDASTLDTLGLALFRAGHVERAIEVQSKAVELAKGDKQDEKEFRLRLTEFQNAKRNL